MQKSRYVALFVVFSAGVCAAELKPYAGVDVGGAFTHVKSTNSSTPDGINSSGRGVGVEGAVGLAFKPDNLFDSCVGGRVEVAIASQYTRVDGLELGGPSTKSDGDLYVSTFFANGYLDLYSDQGLSAYVMGGLGNANMHYEDDYYIYEASSFAAQIGAGLAYAVSENIAIDLRYKYMKTTPKYDDIKLDIYTSFVGIGARVTF